MRTSPLSADTLAKQGYVPDPRLTYAHNMAGRSFFKPNEIRSQDYYNPKKYLKKINVLALIGTFRINGTREK